MTSFGILIRLFFVIFSFISGFYVTFHHIDVLLSVLLYDLLFCCSSQRTNQLE